MAASPISRATAWPASSFRSVSTTRAPSRASSKAFSLPTPLAAPVTMAIFPSTRLLMACLLGVFDGVFIAARLVRLGCQGNEMAPGIAPRPDTVGERTAAHVVIRCDADRRAADRVQARDRRRLAVASFRQRLAARLVHAQAPEGDGGTGKGAAMRGDID